MTSGILGGIEKEKRPFQAKSVQDDERLGQNVERRISMNNKTQTRDRVLPPCPLLGYGQCQ